MSESGFRTGRVDWLGALAGGLVFGAGAMLAGGCAGRTVVNAAEGNLGSLLALFAFSLSAYAVQFGFLEPLHMGLARATYWSAPGGDASLAAVAGVPAWTAGVLLCLAFLGAAWYVRGPLVSAWSSAAGAAIGALVVAGWWTTGHLAQAGFDIVRPESISFSGALARVVRLAVSGHVEGSLFGPLLVAGTMVGTATAALATRSFRWVAPPRSRLGHFLTGGVLMGVGAALAGGCNIGNGLSGVSALSLRAVIATGAIGVGLHLGLAWLRRSD